MNTHDKEFTYLVAVDPMKNNYKYYYAIKNGESFKCKYGRIGLTEQESIKNSSGWRSKYRTSTSEKKGYVDRSDYFELIKLNSSGNTSSYQYKIDEPLIHDLIVYLMKASNKAIEENYVIGEVIPSDKLFTRVNQLLNDIKKKLDINCNIDSINKTYLELLSLSQRKIKKVEHTLFNPITNQKELDEAINKIVEEQDLLDTLESNVKTQKATIAQKIKDMQLNKDTTDNRYDILNTLGINIELTTKKEDDYIKTTIKNNHSYGNKQFKCAYKITNLKTQPLFDKHIAQSKNKTTQLLWHGSKTCNYLSIMEKSLLVRPTFAGYNGSLFNDGIYFANKHEKSINYTDGGMYARGNTLSKQILLLFDVHYGNPYEIKSGTNYNSNTDLISICKKNNYDSVHAHKGLIYNNYSDLKNDEIIVYNNHQCTPKYIVEFE